MAHDLHTLTHLPTLEDLLRDEGLDGLLAALDDALARLPAEARARGGDGDGPEVSPRTLRILRTALQRDAGLLRDHPETLFQGLYNRLRWFDAPDAAAHFQEEQGPWSRPDAHLHALAEHWRRERAAQGTGRPWLESLLPLRDELEGVELALRHEAQVLQVAYSPTGDRLATGSWADERNVLVWDAATGERLLALDGHEGEIRALAWSPDGARLASGSRDHDARLWDARTGELLHAMTGQEGQVTAVAFSPDGQVLATGNLGWKVRLFDVASGEKERTFSGHMQSVLTLAFHPSGRWLASGSSDNTVRVWDVETGAEVARLEAETSVDSVAFSPDGEWLAFTDFDGIALAETRGWTRQGPLRGQGRYSSVTWLDAHRLGLLSFNRVEVLDARGGDVLHTHPYESDSHQRTASFQPGGTRFALSGADGRACVSDLTAPPPPTLRAGQRRVQGLWGHPGGRVVVARALRESVAIDSGGRVRPFPVDPEEAFGQPWRDSPDGARMAYPTRKFGRPPLLGVRVLDMEQLVPALDLTAPPLAASGTGHAPPLDERPVAFSPDGRRVAAVLEPGAVRVWHLPGGALAHTLRGPRGPIDLVDFTPDGAHVVASFPEESRLLVFSLASGARVLDTHVISNPTPAWAAARAAPLLAVGQDEGALELFDLSTGQGRTLRGGDSPIIGLGFTDDGTRVAACAMDWRVRVFDTRTGALLHELPHPSLAFAVALRDGLLVTRANDLHTRIFDLETGALRADLDGGSEPDDVTRGRFWELLSDGPVSFHSKLDPTTPLTWFEDSLEEVLILQDGLVVGRGQTVKDFLYVLRLHPA
ncbi:High-affnity carbon uptake protein Hat/HatR [Myxococcus sp. K15C18031901]|uniref:WD40 repeat domain-containing protein n=1 Tax=Myxococcus dinghuensis TaxID=2906761 RepID=UPI0020A708FA|nr:High-affnity carbon uptake protein Hat/HatR [Myxococcus dinghuensis]MCP3100231.1 High-affnity carbon uptake protein Hat/HatR [Myxococcus dinghuensis]